MCGVCVVSLRLMLFTTTVQILMVRTGSVQSCHQTPIFPYRGRARQTIHPGSFFLLIKMGVVDQTVHAQCNLTKPIQLVTFCSVTCSSGWQGTWKDRLMWSSGMQTLNNERSYNNYHFLLINQRFVLKKVSLLLIL